MQPAALICSLLLQIKKDPKVKNVLHYNNLIECLDLHLTEIDLIDYRGSTSEIKLARFFVREASVLKLMRFGVLWRNNEWRADHRKRLSLNDKVSAEAEFVFETSSGQRLETYLPISDLSGRWILVCTIMLHPPKVTKVLT